MIQFEVLWAFILLPLPFLVYWLGPVYESGRDALRAPFFGRFKLDGKNEADNGAVVIPRKRWQVLLVIVMWCSLVTAAAKPVWLSDAIEIKVPARNLMIMIDLSGSMAEEDFGTEVPRSRLEGAKLVMANFVKGRSGDLLSLVVFGDAPFMLMPFSDDRKLFIALLEETQVRMAGPKTMLGDAIGFAYQHFLSHDDFLDNPAINEKRVSITHRTVILLTDGSDSGSLIPPVEAAELAAGEGIHIYPILLGRADAVGEQQIDDVTLQKIAQLSGGVYFEAEDESALERISVLIDKLEPVVVSTSRYQPSAALYYWPLLLGIVSALLCHLFVGIRQLKLDINQIKIRDSFNKVAEDV